MPHLKVGSGQELRFIVPLYNTLLHQMRKQTEGTWKTVVIVEEASIHFRQSCSVSCFENNSDAHAAHFGSRGLLLRQCRELTLNMLQSAFFDLCNTMLLCSYTLPESVDELHRDARLVSLKQPIKNRRSILLAQMYERPNLFSGAIPVSFQAALQQH